jgi:hypothetical protein
MSDDEFEEEVEGDGLDELDDLNEDLDEDLDELDEDLDEDDDLTDTLDEDEEDVEDDDLVDVDRPTTTTTDEEEDEDVLDLDEELHPDDVEAPLDALLQERTASATLEDEEDEVEDEETDVDERGEGPTRIVPRRPGEFLCSSCFLVLPRHQLADEKRMLCQDCA